MKIVTILAIILFSSSSAFAGCISTECEQKLEQIITAAERGNMQARVVSAISMLDIHGIYYDSKKAIKYLNIAKQSHNGAATWVLSKLYREGRLVEQDLKKADYLSSLANERGFSDNLGVALFSEVHYEDLVSAIDLSPETARNNYNPAKVNNLTYDIYHKAPTFKRHKSGRR